MVAAKKEQTNEQMMKEMAKGFGIDTKGKSLVEFGIGWAGEELASSTSPAAERVGHNLAIASGLKEGAANKVATYVAFAWRTVLTSSMTLYNAFRDMKKTLSAYTGLSTNHRRSLAATGHKNYGMVTALNTDLEVVRNERKLLASQGKNELKGMFLDMLLDAPSNAASSAKAFVQKLKAAERYRKTTPRKKFKQEVYDQLELEAKTAEASFDSVIAKLNKGTPDAPEYNSAANSLTKLINRDEGAQMRMGAGLETLKTREDKIEFVENANRNVLGFAVKRGLQTLKPMAKKFFNLQGKDAFTKPTAGKMIKELGAYLKKNPSPVGITLPGCSRKECSLEEYIMDIFQQHEVDCGRGEMSERVQSELHDAAEQIAEAMVDPQRRLHADALEVLVDKKYGINSFGNGKVIDIQTGTELDETLAKLHKQPGMSNRKRMSAEKHFKQMQAPKELIQATWDNLNEDEKFMFSSFFPREVLADLGASREEIQEYIYQKESFYQEITEQVLKELSQFNGKQLAGLGFNESQVKLVREAVSGMNKRNSHYIHKHRHELTDLVADAAVLADSKMRENGQPDFLKKILNSAQEKRSHKDIIRQKQKEKPLAEQVQDSRSESSTETSRY